MISVQEATQTVLSNLIHPKDEEVPIDQSQGRILREDIVADRDFPAFNRVMMDGIAISSKAWEEGRRAFDVAGMQTAGSPQETLEGAESCIEVMTGAMLPRNADIVIRYEDVQIEGGVARVTVEEVRALQNVHLKGTDRKMGDLLMTSRRMLSPAEVAVLATVGKTTVKVAQSLKIAIVSTGDELVDINETPHPYQIRKSNTYALQAALACYGHQANTFHIVDEQELLKKQLADILNDHDAVMLSGGVSKGKKDYVPETLDHLKVQRLFHGVKQRPGKPFWFGVRNNDTVVFALPGNPVSTFMCLYKYVIPWVKASFGLSFQQPTARLTESFAFGRDMTYFLQVKVKHNEEGCLLATPVAGKGSGDLANLLEADAFLELPANKDEFKEGEAFPLYTYRGE